jgi:hypothetical protein
MPRARSARPKGTYEWINASMELPPVSLRYFSFPGFATDIARLDLLVPGTIIPVQRAN